MTASAPRLLLLPFAALGDEAALGVWARQLPQLLGRALQGTVTTVAPLWRDAGSGRLVRAGAALPASVVAGEAEAAAADWVLTGAVSQTDEGIRAELELVAVGPAAPAQKWSLLFPLTEAGATFGTLTEEIATRLGQPVNSPVRGADAPLWPLLCDLDIEAELLAGGIGALTQPSAAWRHLASGAGLGAASWATARVQARRVLLQRIAPDLLAAFDADLRPADTATPASDLSTDEVLRLLGIPSDPTTPPPHG